jgi:DedD protein
MPDEGPQEIQLRGKQLVFLAMSATVVAVVIFLCGVMVGRGVPTARQAATEPIEADAPAPDETQAPAAESISSEATEGTAAAPTTLEYAEIVSEQPPAERPLKPSAPARQPFAADTAVARVETPAKAAPAVAASRPAEKPAAKPAPKPAAAVAPASASASTSPGGFQVQVAAYQREGDASTVRDRLVRKGYPAFLTTATTPAGTWFRVRVGGYQSRDEAQAVATRLKREEQLEPWVTR